MNVSSLLQGTKPLTMSSVAAPSRHSPGTVSHVDSPPRVDEYAVAMQAAKRLAVRAAPPIPPGPRWLQRRAGCVQGACLPLEARCESSASIHTSPARGPLLTGDPHVPVHVQKLFYSRRSAKAKANAIRSSHFHRRGCHFRLKRTECYCATPRSEAQWHAPLPPRPCTTCCKSSRTLPHEWSRRRCVSCWMCRTSAIAGCCSSAKLHLQLLCVRLCSKSHRYDTPSRLCGHVLALTS